MSDRRRRVLVLVDVDPRSSDRALEALRMSVGVALAEVDVRVLLTGEASRLRDADLASLPGGSRASGFLDALDRLGAEVTVDDDPAEWVRSADVVLRWTS